jgi:hypothetical protein
MEVILRLIESGDTELAFRETEEVVEDFYYHKLTTVEEGLKTNIARINKEFGTDLQALLDESLRKRAPDALKRTLQTLGVLLMLEKFKVLEEMFNKKNASIDTQRKIYWLGRNYFTLLLEPTLAKYDPSEEMQMDRLLDRMLYRLEDRKWNEFRATKIELVKRIVEYFKLPLPSSILDKLNS